MFTVTQDRSYLFLGLLLMAASVAIGAVVRRVGAGEITTRFAQFLPVLLLPWLVPALRNPWKLAAETIDYVQQAFAPMPYQEGFAVFTATMLWVVFLVVETLTNGLRSPGWTFPVLVMPYAVCALAIYTETNPFLFAFPAIGFIAVLGTSVRNDALAALPEAQANLPHWRTGVTRAAATAGGLALVASVLLSVPIAERSANAANPSGSGAVLLGDPSLDLIRNVTAASDQKVISYTTTDTGGQYLRLAALPAFDDRGFHLTADGADPAPAARRPAGGGRRHLGEDVGEGRQPGQRVPADALGADPGRPRGQLALRPRDDGRGRHRRQPPRRLPGTSSTR